MTWRIPDPSQPLLVNFQLECIFRLSYFTTLSPPINPTVGGQLNFAVADNTNELQWGDGTSQAGVYGIVLSINTVQDSLTAIFNKNHTYPSAASFTAYFKSHARLATLENNPNANYTVSTMVTLGSTVRNFNSPVSSSLPIIPATQNLINHIQLRASDAEDGTNVMYALSSPTQQGQANSTQPPNFSIDASSGVITWNTNGLTNGLYNAQIRITDQSLAFIVLDFLLNLTVASSVPPPFFQAPSPADGASLMATVGNQLSITICAADSDASVAITLSAGSLPSGVTFNPTASSNPICVPLTWTPTAGEAGESYSFPFEATTDSGASATLSFTVTVPALATSAPSAMPTGAPTPMPTDMPTGAPTPMPTDMPTDMPTGAPTPMPTDMPTGAPSPAPSAMPTGAPTPAPSAMPSQMPTAAPTPMPATGAPTATPTPSCGDAICQSNENCDSCPTDCNACPQVLYNRAEMMVATATSFTLGATINLTTWDGSSRPNMYQAWSYDSSSGRIYLCANNSLILGAGPVAQKQATTEHHITWDFKAALLDVVLDPSIVHEFAEFSVSGTSNPTWYYLQDKLFYGSSPNMNNGNASCLMSPYSKSPANVANKEVWGPNCLTNTYFQWRFQTFICDNGVKCGC